MRDEHIPEGRTVVLVACSAGKLKEPARAKDLYRSDLFKKSKEYAERYGDLWFVLSAKYGLLEPDETVEPYDESLNDVSSVKRRLWAVKVDERLRKHLLPGDRVVFLAGKRYREHLEPEYRDEGYVVEVPLEGLGIGRQLARLKELNNE